ncbi:hypothetical protein LPJ75_002527 [Coemansia sp. RSA 2598]|nr:hypothetical protein LPJ75_002527 [Coemansia sp. RSA 2598]
MQQHTPNNARGRQMMPNSDSKYSSHTGTSRVGNESRLRAQRRKTDGSDEIKSLRRPSTSHGPSTMRKATYSQYPDFETIKDPFAKRDKIPRKHRQPLPLGDANGASNVGDAAHVLGTESGSKADDAHAPVAAVDHARKDSQEGVPTPLKKRDKIPRHAVNRQQQQQQPLQLISPPPAAQVPVSVEALQMEPMDSPFPDSPVTPVAQIPVQSIDRSLIAETLVSPVSLESPPSANNRRNQPEPVLANAPAPAPARTASLQPVDTTLAAAMTPVGAMSPRTNSPRMHIDMDKVETLYARQSMIFERNKQMRDSKLFSSSEDNSRRSAKSSVVSSQGQPSTGPKSMDSIPEDRGAAIQVNSCSQAASEERSKCGNGNVGGNDEDDDQHIPFDQVLIPTAFKRLRTLLEDPSFEIDDETYRRFKLSERWYARQERLQVELAFNMGTFGESKRRERVIQKRQSGTNQASIAHASANGEQETGSSRQEEPTMPSPAATDNKSVLPALTESDDNGDDDDDEQQHDRRAGNQAAAAVALPERRRNPLRASEFDHKEVADPGAHYGTPTSYAPSVHHQPSYETDQSGYVPPRQPKPAQIQPFGVQDPDFVPMRTHSRHDNPLQQDHRHLQQQQQQQQQRKQHPKERLQQQQSSSPAQKKQALCGLCIIM